ncbi:hypothetical protein ACVWZ8_003911 [Arthrobacter sp. UYCu723]
MDGTGDGADEGQDVSPVAGALARKSYFDTFIFDDAVPSVTLKQVQAPACQVH